MRPVGLGTVLPAIESCAQSSDLGNIPSSPSMETFERYCHLRNKLSSPSMETFERYCHLRNKLSSPLMETFAQPRDCTKKSPLPRWRPLHNCLFRDGQSSPAPSPVCWGRLGWGSPYHTGGYANVSLMETIAQPRDCTKKSPLLRWTPLHNCLFRDGRSSPAPFPVCWGRLGWGSPFCFMKPCKALPDGTGLR